MWFDKIRNKGTVTQKGTLYLLLSLLFLVSLTYFYFFGKGVFFYQENSSLFIFSSDYFQQFTARPGGLLVYAGNFLTQFYFNAIYGSLIVSLQIVLFCVVFINIIRRLPERKNFSTFFIFMPACLLLVLQTRVDFLAYYIPGFLLVAAWFMISIRAVTLTTRIIVLTLFPLFYYLVGSFALVYLGLFIFYAFSNQTWNIKYILPASLILLALLTLFTFKDVVFFQPVDSLLVYPLFSVKYSGLTVLLSMFCGFIILVPLLIRVAGFINLGRKSEQTFSLAATIALILGTIFLLIKDYDSEVANTMEVEKMVYGQKWDEVIKKHETRPASNIIEEYYYNLALAEKGQLCSRMFFGSQNYGSMSLMLRRESEQTYRALYFYYCIGLASEAHHLAYELMVQHGYRPENIKMLIKTELINGHLMIAKRYIDVLKKTIHYKTWAKEHEKMLATPDLINSDPELGEKIRMLPNKDFFIDTDDSKNIELLLKVNPDNKKAFEYKLARLLFEKDLLEIGNEVKKMKEMGYSRFPRHIEEAIVALVNVTKKFPDLGGLSINPDTESRFIQYFSALNSFKGDKALIEKGIKKTERNTFWYYLQFGLVRSDLFKTAPADKSIY